jgi:peptidoglycan/xylan/chitin deacetylase (PgdA/CDA1 family)
VQWDVAGFDWKRITAQQIADNVLRKARPGSIILLHDGDSAGKHARKNTVEALPLIIRGLRDRDFQIAPLSQLLPEKTCNLTKGKRIHD